MYKLVIFLAFVAVAAAGGYYDNGLGYGGYSLYNGGAAYGIGSYGGHGTHGIGGGGYRGALPYGGYGGYGGAYGGYGGYGGGFLG